MPSSLFGRGEGLRRETSGGRHGLTVAFEYLPVVNHAQCQAGLGPVMGVFVRGRREEPDRLHFEIPELDYHLTVDVPAGVLESEQQFFSQSGLPVETGVVSLLQRTVGRHRLRLRVSSESGLVDSVSVSVVEPWYWPHVAISRASVASFVLPGHDKVRQIVREAGVSVDDDVSKVATALYDVLQGHHELTYELPHLDEDEWAGVSHQAVRSPDAVFGRSHTRSGRANCLDLTLLLAGCLEAVGHSPVLCFVKDGTDRPVHAFLGCWQTDAVRLRPLLTDSEAFREYVLTDQLLVLESTGVCIGPERLDYLDALKAARDLVVESTKVFAVDVRACRPPFGIIRPLSLAFDPVVEQALATSDLFIRESGARRRETLHLLYGLSRTDPDLSREIVQSSGGDLKALTHLIEVSQPKSDASSASHFPLRDTANYRICLETARAFAHARESSSVSECDLLWALVENPSVNVRRFLAACGCDLERLHHELERRCPTPSRSSTMRFSE